MDVCDTMKTVTMRDEHYPDAVLPVDAEFTQQYVDAVCEGAVIAKDLEVVIVGLARNLGDLLPVTMDRIYETANMFKSAKVVIVENDSTDGTAESLEQWAKEDPGMVIVETTTTGRPQLRGFEPERMQYMAEYRARCQELVRQHCHECDYVIVVDTDAWGGWSNPGVLNGIAWHERNLTAGCMASTSLFKHAGIQVSGESKWCHYDQFAFRWYGWAIRLEPWFPFWLPPPGVDPLEVKSAFGGLAIYKADAYLEAEYSSPDGDCEHVHFHKSMLSKGWTIHLNPAQRCVMSWLVDEEPSDAAEHHIDDQHRTVSV
jgi:hypothetical protein